GAGARGRRAGRPHSAPLFRLPPHAPGGTAAAHLRAQSFRRALARRARRLVRPRAPGWQQRAARGAGRTRTTVGAVRPRAEPGVLDAFTYRLQRLTRRLER